MSHFETVLNFGLARILHMQNLCQLFSRFEIGTKVAYMQKPCQLFSHIGTGTYFAGRKLSPPHKINMLEIMQRICHLITHIIVITVELLDTVKSFIYSMVGTFIAIYILYIADGPDVVPKIVTVKLLKCDQKFNTC